MESLSFSMPLSLRNFATVVPFRRAILSSVSPFRTLYVPTVPRFADEAVALLFLLDTVCLGE